MATIDDLISSLNGGVHVSQEGYDLQALQKYLADNLALPPLACSPAGTSTYRPLAPSRSASVSRYALGHATQADTLASPSSISNTLDHGYGSRSTSRPGYQRRSSSRAYAFYNPHAAPASSPGVAESPMMEYAAFEGDAFAPLTSTHPGSSFFGGGGGNNNAWAGFGVTRPQEGEAGPSDPWARIRAANQVTAFGQAAHSAFGSAFGQNSTSQGVGASANSGFSGAWPNQSQGQSSVSAFARPEWEQGTQHQHQQHGASSGYRSSMDCNMDEDDEMDEDLVDQAIGGGYAQPASVASPGLGLQMGHGQAGHWAGWGGQAQLGGVSDQWDRGRR